MRIAIGAAAAAIIVVALGACSSTTTTHGTSTAANVGSSGNAGTLTGAGSTYVAPFFSLAFARYHQQHPAVTVTYSPVGSSAGIAAISTRQVDFGASDVPMNASELTAAKGGSITQVPDALGAEGIAYHLSLPAGARLHLTGPVLAGIFLGQITHWNDPAITARQHWHAREQAPRTHSNQPGTQRTGTEVHRCTASTPGMSDPDVKITQGPIVNKASTET